MAIQNGLSMPVIEQIKWEQTTESRISTVFSMLPVSLQSRMSPLRHFRRSASLGNLRMFTDSDGTASPRRRPLSADAMTGLADEQALTKPAEAIDISQARESAMNVVSVRLETAKADAPNGASAGINWRFANQGVNLVRVAADSGANEHNDAFERKAFVDGLTYLLRALPEDLEQSEADQIRFALPSDLAPIDQRLDRQRMTPWKSDPEVPRSSVHRLVQMAVVQIFLFLHFILPYLILLLKFGASVERRYRVSETVVEHLFSILNVIGRQCSYAAEVVSGTNDGKVGQNLSTAAAWMVEEVTRGISDGVGEGLMMTKPRESPR